MLVRDTDLVDLGGSLTLRRSLVSRSGAEDGIVGTQLERTICSLVGLQPVRGVSKALPTPCERREGRGENVGVQAATIGLSVRGNNRLSTRRGGGALRERFKRWEVARVRAEGLRRSPERGLGARRTVAEPRFKHERVVAFAGTEDTIEVEVRRQLLIESLGGRRKISRSEQCGCGGNWGKIRRGGRADVVGSEPCLRESGAWRVKVQ